MINLRRDAKETALCGMAILAVWYATQIGGFGSSMAYTTAAVPVQEQHAASLGAINERADIPQTTGIGIAAVSIPAIVSTDDVSIVPVVNAVVTLAVQPDAVTATTNVTAVDEPIVVAALSDPSFIPAPEAPSVQAEIAIPTDPATDDAKPAVSRLEILDECLDADACIDRYLWALYQRTPKEDTLTVHERRKVAVKRKRKMVTVTRTFTKRVNQDFTWKDPNAAEKADMPMMDYVIGGMDRSFKTKLFHALYAAEQAGLSPGITSAFRDDYRQSIASGLKAATDRSFHGGSMRGGYGHGLAADIVSVDGATRAQRWASTEKFWKWIDANGKEFGIGRPYLGGDPPHVGPIDGKEYIAKREMKALRAMAAIKKRSQRVAHASAAKTHGKHNTVQASSPARETKPKAVSDRQKMAMAERGRD
jgi:hypothetical protein